MVAEMAAKMAQKKAGKLEKMLAEKSVDSMVGR